MPNDEGFILTHYAGKRNDLHVVYARMFDHFPRALIERLNRECDPAKIDAGGTRGGGDPDLFLFRGRERFFVEVKDEDRLKPKQIATFAKIREILGCQVRIARIRAVVGARPGDGLLAQLGLAG
jgi:hypothetical protein